MKKKLIMVLIAMGMVCSLPACGVSENGKGTEKTSILKKDDFGVTLGEFSKKATIEEKVLYDKDNVNQVQKQIYLEMPKYSLFSH